MPLPIDRIERLIALDPNDATLHFALGQACLEAGRFAEAVSALERAIALTPRYTAAYWPLGKALEGAGRLADAIPAYKRGIAVGKETGDVIPTSKMQARLKRLRRQSPPGGSSNPD
jgi:tetratricopeptide (TPR) repeat protein